MAKKLSDAELWDDDYLHNSWESAVEEYKKYHSLHARGEKVERVLQESSDEELEQEPEDSEEVDMEADIEVVDSQKPQPGAEMNQDMAVSGEEEFWDEDAEIPDDANARGDADPSAVDEENSEAIAQAVLGSVKDENLKNMVMSWYWAGYYTGYHAGQKSAP